MKETREIIKNSTIEKVELEKPFEPALPTNGHYPQYRGVYAQERSQILDYWRAIRKRLWLVIGIAVLMTTLAAIYMARRPNIYQARAQVQVDLEQANPDLIVTSERRLPSLNADPAYFNTQLQLLTSENLLRRVIKDMSLDSNKEFQKEKKETSVSAWKSLLKTVGLASDIEKKEEKGVEEITSTNALASSDEIAEAVRLAPYVEILKKNLIVEPVRESRATVKDTRLIEIYYKHTDPNLAAGIVNGIAATFTKQNQEKRTGTNKETNEFLNTRVAELQSDIRSGENRLVSLKRESGIINTGEGDQTIVIDRLSGLNRQLLEAEEQRKNAQAAFQSVESSPDRLRSLVEVQMARYLTEQENDIRRLVNETNRDIAKLRAERAKLLEEYKPGADVIKQIDEQINTLESEIEKARRKNETSLEDFRTRVAKNILDDLRTKYLQARQKEDQIKSAFDVEYNQAQGQNQSAVTIRLLQQDIDTKKGFLKNLIDQQQGNDVIASGTDNNISIAEIAIPPDEPISPKRLMTVVVALFLSTLFGAGLALLLEYLDDTIHSTEEVENYLGLPALAAIPTIDSLPKRKLLLVGGKEEGEMTPESELLIFSDPRSSLAEAYRQLRTSILLSTAGHAPKSLLITSSLPSEGKTTTAVNTAISLAQTGAKVLIIDADMRRPRLHSIFNISNAEGLSTILSSDLSEEEILDIVQVEETTKLRLLPSGPVPPNPAELIGSEQMAKLIKILQNNFTHVVVDSPPIASFTDGVLIASLVDGVILVVHSGKSSRQVVRRSRQLLQDIGAKIFGVVLNNVNLRSQDNYYYQSYYHRNYYRHESEEDEQ